MGKKIPPLGMAYQQKITKERLAKDEADGKALRKGKWDKTKAGAAGGGAVLGAVNSAVGAVDKGVKAATYLGVGLGSAGTIVAPMVVAAPFMPFIAVPLTLADKLKQYRRWKKTGKHLTVLKMIREDAARNKKTFNLSTFRAIEYVIAQKEKKKSRSGARGLVPGYTFIVQMSHWRKKKKTKSLGVDRSHFANVLWRNAQLGDQWAKETVRELVGTDKLTVTLGSIKGRDLLEQKLKSAV